MTGVNGPKSGNISWQQGRVTRTQRESLHGHRGVTLWLTGLSGSGKTTLAQTLELALAELGCFAYVLDGDNMRHGLNRDLGFSREDRGENIRRVGEVAKLFTDAGAIVIAAFISPYRADRARVRGLMAEGDFVEVHLAAPLAVCEERDPKGLYKRARSGEIRNFTGVSAPYEPPEDAELVIETHNEDPTESAARALSYLVSEGYVPAD